MNIIYPAEIHIDEDGLWLKFVDFDCFTEGETMDELLDNAAEALECHALGLLEAGEKMPAATGYNKLHNGENLLYTLIRVDVDLAKNCRSVKKTLTIPEWLNKQAMSRNLNFSKILQEALIANL